MMFRLFSLLFLFLDNYTHQQLSQELVSSNHQVMLFSTENSARLLSVAAWTGEAFGGGWIHVCVWPSPSAVRLKLLQHC